MKKSKTAVAVAFLVVLGVFLAMVLLGAARVALGLVKPVNVHRYSGPVTYTGLVDWFENTCRAFCTTELPGQTELMEANARINKLAGKWIFENTDPPVVHLNNGCWESAEHIYYYLDQSDAKVDALWDYVEGELGVPYLYVQAPCKHCELDPQLPMEDMTNVNEEATELLKCLEERDISCLDLRRSLHQDGLDHYGCFFVTDHHWTPETGLWAARTMAEELNRRCGLELDTAALAEERFACRVWEDAFLGSWGRKVTMVYAQPEDFVLLVPTEAVHLRMTVPKEGIDVSGGFDILYNEEKIVPGDYYRGNSYGALLQGDQGYVSVENLDRPDGPVVAVLRESFAGAAGPYLALAAGELHLIDARYYDGSVKALLEEIRPDVVVSLLNVQCHTGAYMDMIR